MPSVPTPPGPETVPDGGPPAPAQSPENLDDTDGVPTEQPASRPTPMARRWPLIVVSVLVVVLLGVLATGVWLYIQLDHAREQIDEQNNQIREQDEQIREQEQQIDRKESFGAAMAGLQETIAPLAALPFAELVPWSDYERLAAQAWSHRRDVAAMDRHIEAVEVATAQIAERKKAARVHASSNASGSAWEATLDQLGSGWVTTSIENVTFTCDGDPLACVDSRDPFIVHVNIDSGADSSMTDWIRTGVAYHEFAHVLQNLNPEATAMAVTAFAGDEETMADCYALTMLPGWSLDHEVPINADEYWEVSVGYGYTCNESQRQSIRDWSSQIGVEIRTIGVS